jgi:hypothetical protein
VLSSLPEDDSTRVEACSNVQCVTLCVIILTSIRYYLLRMTAAPLFIIQYKNDEVSVTLREDGT